MSNPIVAPVVSSAAAGGSGGSMAGGVAGVGASPVAAVPSLVPSGGAADTVTSGSSSTAGNIDNIVPFWDFDSVKLDEWVRSITVLFPHTGATGGHTNNQRIIAEQLWANLNTALNSLSSTTIAPKSRRKHNVKKTNLPSGPGVKQQQLKPSKKKEGEEDDEEEKIIFDDPYQIWFDLTQTVPNVMGAKLAELNVGGLMNALSLKPGGVVNKFAKPIDKSINFATNIVTINNNSDGGVITVKLGMIMKYAVAISQSIKRRVEGDILIMTPLRIQQMLAPDLQNQEFRNIRKRVFDTVVLGKGVNGGVTTAGDPDEGEIPVGGTGQNVHDIEKFKKCHVCGNNDQSSFILDRKNGDVICSNCGVVVSESIMHEGSQYRKFEGEADRNHHGDAANPLYSNAHNMSTTLGGIQVTSGAGMGGFGSSGSGKSGLETVLRNAHAYTELNISSFGKEAGRTRVGYKDKQKKQAFVQMTHVGDALNLHEAVVQRAKELFAGFRDDRELVHQLKGVIGACLCEAFDQLSRDGRQILQEEEKQKHLLPDSDKKQKGNEKAPPGSPATTTTSAAAAPAVAATTPLDTSAFLNKSTRAARRNQLHKASMAGKGGLLLDFSNVSNITDKNSIKNTNNSSNIDDPRGTPASELSSSPSNMNNGGDDNDSTPLEEKPIPSWNSDDCRSWLTEISRTIAKYWINERDKQDKAIAAAEAAAEDEKNGTSSNQTSPSKIDTSTIKKVIIPEGNMDELEGRLIGHAITLSEYLEKEANAYNETNANTAGSKSSMPTNRKRVVTPRVSDMSKLGIRWQHSHERGSGGKGGVGNSGTGKRQLMMMNNTANKKARTGSSTVTATAPTNKRTPGQILILISAKKLGNDILEGDTIAGDAIHRELRLLVGRQEARKKKLLSEETTRQRLMQMKRKPWLQARALQDD